MKSWTEQAAFGLSTDVMFCPFQGKSAESNVKLQSDLLYLHTNLDSDTTVM